jgi:hypothetical protein
MFQQAVEAFISDHIKTGEHRDATPWSELEKSQFGILCLNSGQVSVAMDAI